MAESDAGRSTVMRALKELEASGFITREPQFHDSGARRSSRYYLNHPLAPHCSPRLSPGPPSRFDTGPVSTRYGACVRTTPHRGAKSGPLEPPSEPPTQPPADAASVLRAMPQPWRVGGKDARNLIPAIEAALASGWTTENLTAHLSRRPGWRPKPGASPGSTSRGSTRRTRRILPHRGVVRRMRRRAIAHDHRNLARRNRSCRVLPAVQSAGTATGAQVKYLLV